MNIMIQMEIKARELESRGLLALVAAERGHNVLLGDVRRYLTARMHDFAPGVFHDKSLTPSIAKRRLFARLEDHGSLLTSQDEEHWLNLLDFNVPAVRRFSDETLGRAAISFAWGNHERDALVHHYPAHTNRVVASGSPRVDLWSPALRPYHVAAPLPGLPEGQPFVLVSSNFSFVLEVNRFWVRLRDKRQHFHGIDDDYEFERYDAIANKMRVLRHFVRAIRHLATSRPDVLVVVRPHPLDVDGAWEDLIGTTPNVLITRERSLNAWLRRASAVIHNGCTAGWESVVAGTPAIAFHPDGIFAELPVNSLDRRASTMAELDQQLDLVLNGAERSSAAVGADALLHRRLTIDPHRLAADHIVDRWDALPAPEGLPTDVDRVLRGRRILEARRRAGTVKHSITGSLARLRDDDGTLAAPAFITAHKFPPITRDEVRRVVDGLSRALNRFAAVQARVVAPDLVALARR
jgi:surface carbohydrate biosynthesis protein